MSVSDPIADMLTKIRNGAAAGKEVVKVPASNLKLEIVRILKSEGYIRSYVKIGQPGLETLEITLKYDEAERSVIHGLERRSKSGRRQYSGYQSMPRVFNGFGTLIVSTSKGVTTGKQAADNKVGGEIICSVW
ncbi:MAG: 30S ribosomal protein S8 [Spirochaetaceae bacterium]|jgi:small subunit ribosomal protein S8|nr:30S ribosomal protein S8 [Spirochaetaceae bacterium]